MAEIKHINEVEAVVKNQGEGNVFSVKAISETLHKCSLNVVELQPGNQAYGYHYHDVNEEIFYIVSGQGIVETNDGVFPIKQGDVLVFPTGKEGAHVVRNNSDDVLVYLDFGTKSEIDLVHLPHVGKLMVATQSSLHVVEDPNK